VFLPKFALIKRAMMNEQVDWQERKSDRANLSGWTTQVDWVRNIGPPYTQHTHRADGCGVSRGGTITSAGFYYYWSGARAEQRVRRRRPGSRCFLLLTEKMNWRAQRTGSAAWLVRQDFAAAAIRKERKKNTHPLLQ
jgi:hypothetical protein